MLWEFGDIVEFSYDHLKLARPFACIENLHASHPITFVPNIGWRGVRAHPVSLKLRKF